AVALMEGKGYTAVNGKPTAYWPIGYPLFLAGLYKLFGPHFYLAKAANVMMGTLTVGLTYLLGHRLAGFWTGLFAGLALAFLPSQIEWTSVLCSEILATLLLIASTYVMVARRPERQRWFDPAVSGLLLGAATLTRATTLALPAGALVFYWLFGRKFLRAVAATAIFVAGMILVVAPMTIRNYMIFHALIPVSTNGGINLWMANNPHATGEYYWPEDPKQNPLAPYLGNEVAADREATRLAIEFIRDHPRQFLYLLRVKFDKFYDNDTNAFVFSLTPAYPPLPGPTMVRITDIADRYYHILKAVALVGIGICLVWPTRVRDWPTFTALIGVIVYFTAVHSVMPAWDRYRFPIMPLFAVLAGCVPGTIIASGQRWIGSRRFCVQGD
ncbi:MAG: glycosyltransferase family 39 protein, partial [Kyrpidia sp.]|nr:glycosyltransferase family 39 protein [Kyrpidia sp.]